MIVVYSKQDPAGVNIANHLRESTVKMELFEVNSEIIYCDNEIKDLKSDYLIFASKHKSETGNACFTAHTPGNWGKAEMGGKDKELCWGSPSAMKTILMNIAHHVELPKLGWPVQMEISHHGPFTKTPCFFVEIGSSEKEWSNELAGKIVLMQLLIIHSNHINGQLHSELVADTTALNSQNMKLQELLKQMHMHLGMHSQIIMWTMLT